MAATIRSRDANTVLKSAFTEQMPSTSKEPLAKESSWNSERSAGGSSTFTAASSPSTARSSVFFGPSSVPQTPPLRSTRDRQSMYIVQETANPQDDLDDVDYGPAQRTRPRQPSRYDRRHKSVGNTSQLNRNRFQVNRGRRIMPTSLEGEAVYGVNYDAASEDYFAMLRQASQLAFEHPSFAFSPLRKHRAKSACFELPVSAPAKVLDLACGVHASWILEAAQIAGWEATEFTGIDIAPNLLPVGNLPDQLAGRLNFITANMLSIPWPVEADSFDLVRLAHLGTAVPDHNWADIFDEANRVCKSTGLIEIVDANAFLSMQKNTMTFPERKEVAGAYKRQIMSSDVATEYLSHAMHYAVIDSKLLSTYPLSAIPSALLLCSKIAESSGIIRLDQKGSVSADNDDSVSSASSTHARIRFDEPSRRVIAHTQAAAVVENADSFYDTFWSGISRPVSWKDSNALFAEFGAIARDAASVNLLLAHTLDWRTCTFNYNHFSEICEYVLKTYFTECDFDISCEAQLWKASSVLSEEMRLLKQSSHPNSKGILSELEKRVRENDVELTGVQQRLYGGLKDDAPGIFQNLEVQAWVAYPTRVSD